jgi:hypothetical protein
MIQYPSARAVNYVHTARLREVIAVITSRKIRGEEHAAPAGEIRSAYKFFARKPDGRVHIDDQEIYDDTS